MKIYVLKRKGYVDYDETAGFVVIALSPSNARDQAYAGALVAEGAPACHYWRDAKLTSCELIGGAKPRLVSQVILHDFKAG